MGKQAKGFSLNEIDQSQAFDLEKDPNQISAKDEIHKLAQNEDAQVLLDKSKSGSDEQAIRLDIDAVDLIKIQEKVKQQDENKESKGKLKYLNAYKKLHGTLSFGRSIPIREKQTFYELLAVMIEAGIPIVKSIKVYAEQTSHKYFKQVCQSIAYQLEKGEKFSQSLADYGKIFTESERGIIAAAEATGRLVDALRRLAGEVEKAALLRSKVRGALIYPSVVMIFVIITIFILLRFVIPQISQLFLDTDLELPAITKFVIGASEFMVENGLLVILAIFSVSALNYGLYQVKKIKYYYHFLFLKLPTFGAFQKDYAQASFARSLANLVASGVSIVQTLEITAQSMGNLVYQKNIRLLKKDVENGISIGDSLENSPYFSNMLVSMISVGEQTAQIDNIANKLANYYTERVTNTAENFSKLLQPFIIGIVGAIVGVIVVSIMLPMTQIIGSVGNL